MDEPLSNLDAKLRVQMRAEIAEHPARARRHDDLRHARPGRGDDDGRPRRGDAQGRAPAGRRPADALRPPGQPLRRRLHRQPGDEHGRGDARAAERRATSRTSATSRSRSGRGDPARPGRRSRRYDGRRVVLGIRPEDLEDAALVPDAPAGRRLRGHTDLTEALGSEIMVHFSIKARHAMTDDVRELAQDVGDERPSASWPAARRRRSSGASARARAYPQGEAVEVAVDTPLAPLLRSGRQASESTEQANQTGKHHERSRIVKNRYVLSAGSGGDRVLVAGSQAARAGGSARQEPRRRLPRSRARSASTASGPRLRAKSSSPT